LKRKSFRKFHGAAQKNPRKPNFRKSGRGRGGGEVVRSYTQKRTTKEGQWHHVHSKTEGRITGFEQGDWLKSGGEEELTDANTS